MINRRVGCALLLCAAVLAGCGSKKAVVTPEGTATVTTDASGDTTTAKVETPEGTATMETTTQGETTTTTMEQANGENAEVQHQEGGSTLTAKDVGVEFYPGSVAKMSNTYKSGPVSTNMVQLTSIDDPDKIMKFYEDQLGKVMSKTTTDKMRTLIKVDGKIQHSIAIETKDGASTITISRVDNSGG